MTVGELTAIRDQKKNIFCTQEDSGPGTRVVVGLATCGIAAGARPVLSALEKEVESRGLSDVSVTMTGCIGICQFEPVVEVYRCGEERVTYVNMTPEKALRVVSEHLVDGKPVLEYTVGAVGL